MRNAVLYAFILVQLIYELFRDTDTTNWSIYYFVSWYLLACYVFYYFAKIEREPGKEILLTFSAMWAFFAGLEISYWNTPYNIYCERPGDGASNYAVAMVLPILVFSIIYSRELTTLKEWLKKKFGKL